LVWGWRCLPEPFVDQAASPRSLPLLSPANLTPRGPLGSASPRDKGADVLEAARCRNSTIVVPEKSELDPGHVSVAGEQALPMSSSPTEHRHGQVQRVQRARVSVRLRHCE
jgi:hypothetical protein